MVFKNLVSSSKNSFPNFDVDKFQDRLFIMSSIIILTIYFINMNYIYKEVYFLGLIPYLKDNIKLKKNSNLNIIFKLILFKFIFLTFMWIFQSILFNKSIFFKGFNILTKGIVDNILIIFLLLLMVDFIVKILKSNIKNLN
tara:strand:- start:64 stop:486 length:423 start_codon:yes stop_codon:yes gene_type:complete